MASGCDVTSFILRFLFLYFLSFRPADRKRKKASSLSSWEFSFSLCTFFFFSYSSARTYGRLRQSSRYRWFLESDLAVTQLNDALQHVSFRFSVFFPVDRPSVRPSVRHCLPIVHRPGRVCRFPDKNITYSCVRNEQMEPRVSPCYSVFWISIAHK